MKTKNKYSVHGMPLMGKYIFSFLITVLILFAFFYEITGCHSPTEPKQNNPPDTTSHNFTWQEYTFGGSGGSSYFKDVAIVNDSDIWAVGEINTSPDTIYNAAHWNGKKWTLLKIPYYYQGQSYYHPIISVFAFAVNDVWFCGNGVIHWDGSQYTPIPLPANVWGAYQINKIWGISDENFYLVGDGGNIAHYANGNWIKMESGTTIDLRDVWGSSDGKTVWACGYSNDNSQSILLKYDGMNWQMVWKSNPSAPPYGGLITSLWGDKNLYLVGTDGVFEQDVEGKDSVSHLFSLTNFPYRIKGSAENNVAAAGDEGMIWHYNGATWKLLNLTTSGHPLYSVALSTKLIVAVGSDYSTFPNNALVYFGQRQQ